MMKSAVLESSEASADWFECLEVRGEGIDMETCCLD